MNWFFKLWKRMQLLRTRDLSFKMEMETENVVSSTALDINAHIAGVLPALRSMRVRLAQLKTRLAEAFFVTDQWGNKTPLVQPAFTADQVSRLRSKSWALALVIVLFVAGEIGLYYLISENLLGGLSGMARDVGVWGLSLAFALFVLFGLAYGLDALFNYIDARELHAQKRIPQRAYRSALVQLVLGVAVALLGLALLTYAGSARIHLIEGSAMVDTGDAALNEKLGLGFADAGRMALVFTYAMAVLLALLKYSMHKAKHELAAYKAWQANVSEQERLVKRIGEVESGIMGFIQKALEVGVQLCHDLQRTYGQQYDPAHDELYRKYVQERAKESFVVTKDVLNKYRPLIVSDEQLFTAAVLEKASLQALKGAAASEVMPADSSLDTLYAGLHQPTATPAALPPAKGPSTNGQAKLDEAIHDLLKA
jgi:hypothetical protein